MQRKLLVVCRARHIDKTPWAGMGLAAATDDTADYKMLANPHRNHLSFANKAIVRALGHHPRVAVTNNFPLLQIGLMGGCGNSFHVVRFVADRFGAGLGDTSR